jgi:hypothetical protein
MIHTLCINVAWCCDEPASCVHRHFQCLPSSTVQCQLSNLSPSWRAGSPDSPSFQDGSHFPRVHAHLLHTVCYMKNLLKLLEWLVWQLALARPCKYILLKGQKLLWTPLIYVIMIMDLIKITPDLITELECVYNNHVKPDSRI